MAMSPMNTSEIIQALTPLVEAFDRSVSHTTSVDQWQARSTGEGDTRKTSTW